MTIKRTFFFLILFSVGALNAACPQADLPSRASTFIQQGNACYDNKEYSQAISSYTEVFKEDPKSIEAALAHYKCAKAFQAMGKYDDAISECSQSIAIDPLMNGAIAYLLRGFLYEKTGNYKDAVSDYSKVLIINPRDEVADVCRKRLLLRAYVEFTNKGLAAFDSGVNAYNVRNDVSAREHLDEALWFFACARRFKTGDTTAIGMTNFTKGLRYQILAREVLDARKPADSDDATMLELRKAYYPLAVASIYYDKALPCLKYEKLINSLKERKAVNDQDMAMVKNKLPTIDRDSANCMKATELEAACVVNFDAASALIAADDHEGARRLLNENDNLAADLKRLKAVNAEGIRYLSSAYARLNTILSYPLQNAVWIEAHKASLENETNAYISDLDRAKSVLVNVALLNTCSGLLQDISALQKTIKEAGN